MQVEIKIVNSDYDLGLDLVESTKFPERRPIIVPGEAIFSSQSLVEGDESVDWCEIIGLTVDINEDTSIDTFASWLYGKLNSRASKIRSLIIAGIHTEIDEAKIAQAIKDGCK